MWKQFLNKLPRKASASKSDGDAAAHRPAAKRVAPGAEPSASFDDVPAADKPALFVSKLDLCCALYDFADPGRHSAHKDAKRQALIDLAEFVPAWPHRFTDPMIAAAFRMFACNLFRPFPPTCRRSSGGGENDEDEPVFDPAWTHLQIVYDLLLKFVASSSLDAKLARGYVDQRFVLRLLELFDSEDPRERECLKAVLHRIYGKFMAQRAFIRKAVSNVFYRFVFETERHSGIAELLEVFGSVISGFAMPLKEEHKVFLCRALIPLHKPKTVGAYLQQLTYCLVQFIEKEPKLTSVVIVGLLKYWPVTNSQKEVMFLGELEELLESTNMAEFQKCMVPLFRRIGCSLNSSHFQVAERALFLWNNDHVIGLMAQNRQVILPLVFPALERNTRHHWNKAVLNVTLNVRKMFSDMDEELFLSCQNKFTEEEGVDLAMAEKRRMAWERLEAAANSAAFQIQPSTVKTIRVTPAVVSPIAAAATPA